MKSALRGLREAAGFTQGELARRTGISRQMIGAIESGRHLPRVDAALALARALEVGVGALFPTPVPGYDVVSGNPPREGALLRLGRVGDRVVTAPLRLGGDGWDVADGYVERGQVEVLHPPSPGAVVVGCEPGLELLERLLREQGQGAVAVIASSRSARRALSQQRAHAAVVHGPRRSRSGVPGVARYRLAAWRVGLAAPADAVGEWWRVALSGRSPVVQREEGAAVQHAFARVAGDGVPGPRVASHVEAARRAVWGGIPAVTIEPAARALGAAFHALETHHAELWVAEAWLSTREVGDALDLLVSSRFRRLLASIGGYDLAGLGDPLG